MIKRVTDERYGKYSVYTVIETGIDVKCPNCGKHGIVSKQEGIYQFICTNCNKSMKTEKFHYCYTVENQCEKCGRYYRVKLTEKTQKNYPALRVECPHCAHRMIGRVQKKKKGYYGCYEHI